MSAAHKQTHPIRRRSLYTLLSGCTILLKKPLLLLMLLHSVA